MGVGHIYQGISLLMHRKASGSRMRSTIISFVFYDGTRKRKVLFTKPSRFHLLVTFAYVPPCHERRVS